MRKYILLLLVLWAINVKSQTNILGNGGTFVPMGALNIKYCYSTNNTDNFAVPQSVVSQVTGALSTPTVAGTYLVNFSGQINAVSSNISTQNASDLANLITSLNGFAATNVHAAAYGAGETLTAGIYTTAGASTLTGVLNLDAQNNANALFVIRIGAAYAIAANTQVKLLNGAQSSNVYFLVNGAPSIGASGIFKGTLIAVNAAISTGDGMQLEGRLLSTGGAIATTNAVVNIPTGTTSIILGNLKTFLAFTQSGAIANTGTFSGNGDLNSGAGSISGYAPSTGIVYASNYSNASAWFGIYANGTLIPASVRTYQTNINGLYNIALGTVCTVAANQTISVMGTVVVGSMSFSNRNFTALAVNTSP